jgi:hypothetical protein
MTEQQKIIEFKVGDTIPLKKDEQDHLQRIAEHIMALDVMMESLADKMMENKHGIMDFVEHRHPELSKFHLRIQNLKEIVLVSEKKVEPEIKEVVA